MTFVTLSSSSPLEALGGCDSWLVEYVFVTLGLWSCLWLLDYVLKFFLVCILSSCSPSLAFSELLFPVPHNNIVFSYFILIRAHIINVDTLTSSIFQQYAYL